MRNVGFFFPHCYHYSLLIIEHIAFVFVFFIIIIIILMIITFGGLGY